MTAKATAALRLVYINAEAVTTATVALLAIAIFGGNNETLPVVVRNRHQPKLRN